VHTSRDGSARAVQLGRKLSRLRQKPRDCTIVPHARKGLILLCGHKAILRGKHSALSAGLGLHGTVCAVHRSCVCFCASAPGDVLLLSGVVWCLCWKAYSGCNDLPKPLLSFCPAALLRSGARSATCERASAEVRGVCVLGCGRCGDSAFCEVKLHAMRRAGHTLSVISHQSGSQYVHHFCVKLPDW
jgi:hypothetical protein